MTEASNMIESGTYGDCRSGTWRSRTRREMTRSWWVSTTQWMSLSDRLPHLQHLLLARVDLILHRGSNQQRHQPSRRGASSSCTKRPTTKTPPWKKPASAGVSLNSGGGLASVYAGRTTSRFSPVVTAGGHLQRQPGGLPCEGEVRVSR